jgi:nitrite reductase/ring-hydroxylating ferredoxin subunit
MLEFSAGTATEAIERAIMDMPIPDFVHAGTIEEVKAKGRRIMRGCHRPILLVYDNGRVIALGNRSPHMGGAIAILGIEVCADCLKGRHRFHSQAVR